MRGNPAVADSNRGARRVPTRALGGAIETDVGA
jgi:hypothetical protein